MGQARKNPRPTQDRQFGASLRVQHPKIDAATIRRPSYGCCMRTSFSRIHPRWESYDYTRSGVYFVTTITHERRQILGAVTRHGIALTSAGRVVDLCWRMVPDQFNGVILDRFVVMPDHVHAIVVLRFTPDRVVSLSQVIGWTKGRSSREINAQPSPPVAPIWQRSFHDCIVRDADALARIRNYLAANPIRAWNEIRRQRLRRIGGPA
jgi:putative transposase